MRAVVCLVLALVVSACSSKPGEPGSCRNEGDNSCTELAAAVAAAGKRMCGATQWTNGAESCPTAGRLGTCASKDGTKHLYGGAPNNYSASSAKAACEFAGGTFSAAP